MVAKRVLTVLDNWEETLCVLLLGASVVIGSMSVFWRYVLGEPFIWTEEGLRLLLVWLTFVGMSMGIKKSAHMRLDLVDGLFSGKPKLGLDLVNSLLMMFFAAVLTFAGWKMVEANWGLSLVATGLPAGLFYLPIVLGAGSMAVRLAVHLVGSMTAQRAGREMRRV